MYTCNTTLVEFPYLVRSDMVSVTASSSPSEPTYRCMSCVSSETTPLKYESSTTDSVIDAKCTPCGAVGEPACSGAGS